MLRCKRRDRDGAHLLTPQYAVSRTGGRHSRILYVDLGIMLAVADRRCVPV